MKRRNTHGQVPHEAATKAEQRLLLEWAWSQVEAMADGSLKPAQRQRMRQAMALDPQLQHAVQSARGLLRRLWGEPRVASSWRALWRLWRIPGQASADAATWSDRGWPQWALATLVVAVVWVFALRPGLFPTQQDAQYLSQQQAALHDFDIAMSYMRKSAEISQRATGRSLGGGLSRALSLSWQTWINDDLSIQNGD